MCSWLNSFYTVEFCHFGYGLVLGEECFIILVFYHLITFLMYTERRSAQCPPPLVQADCNQGGKGLECARTCQNLDLPCVSLACIPGCFCPPGKVGASASFLCMYVCYDKNQPIS